MTGKQLDWSVHGLCPATGKVRLDTLEHAQKFAKRCQHLFGLVMRSYRCPTCHSYHLSRVHKARRTGRLTGPAIAVSRPSRPNTGRRVATARLSL